MTKPITPKDIAADEPDRANETAAHTLRLAMKSKTDAERLAQNVRGKRRYEAPGVSYECPASAVMTACIEPSTPEIVEAGYPFTLVIGCCIAPD